jgi:hypothetical protein
MKTAPNDPEHIAKLENISQKAQHLYALKKQSLKLLAELARTMQYNLELAKTGTDPKDVTHYITGNQIGATHNYKGTRKVKMCAEVSWFGACLNSRHCKPLALDVEVCPECRGAVKTVDLRMSASYLRDKLPRHIVGVELNDGSFAFFENPIAPLAY